MQLEVVKEGLDQVAFSVMEAKDDSYFPFRDLSAWFSCSVNPSIVKLWSKKTLGAFFLD